MFFLRSAFLLFSRLAHLSYINCSLSIIKCKNFNFIYLVDILSCFKGEFSFCLQQAMTNASQADAIARVNVFTSAMQEVRALGLRHNELLRWCREHWPRLVLPALFSEIFDIPKSEEDEGNDPERYGEPSHAGTSN